MPKRFAITLAEFNRVYRTIHGTIANEARAEKGCVFFAIVGSYLLNKEFKIAARPVAGGFVLRPTVEPTCVGYVKDVNGVWSWGEDAFHMWVETEEHIIDFMSPIYREAFAEANPEIAIPRRMFQKRKDAEAQSPNELPGVGDFYTFPDPQLTEELIELFLASPTNTDLLEVVEHWFGSRRGRQQELVQMRSNDGEIQTLSFPTTIASVPW